MNHFEKTSSTTASRRTRFRKTFRGLLILTAVIVSLCTPAITQESEERGPTAFEIGLIKGTFRELSPEADQLFAELDAAIDSGSATLVDSAVAALRAEGMSAQDAEMIGQFAILALEVSQLEQVLGELVGRAGTAFVKGLLEEGSGSSSRPRIWTPGEPHPTYPNVVASWVENSWKPAQGYTWSTPDTGDLRVIRIVPAEDRRIVGKAEFAGSVGGLGARYALQWDDTGRVSGTYYYPKGKERIVYSLTGAVSREAVLYLEEYTGGNLSARITLRERGGRGTGDWEGMMYNTDGRRFKMNMRQLP
jgi:hypothetical protein